MRFNYKFENKKGMMPYKYDNGKIYKITSKQTDKIYIGSTIRSLTTRINEHKSRFNKTKNVCISREILKYDDCEISLIENYPCNNKQELREREGWFQTNFNCVNNTIAGRIIKQYRIDNREKIKEYKQSYYISNKEKLRQYQINNKEKIQNRITTPYTCICGVTMRYDSKRCHEKSIKHKNYIKNLT